MRLNQPNWRYEPDRNPRERRPLPSCDLPAAIPDSKVGQVIDIIERSGALEKIAARMGGRPGPKVTAARTILCGMFLAIYYRGSANLDDACEILHFGLSKRARGWLDIPDIDLDDSCQTRAAYARVERGFKAITTTFDPCRHDRRRRLPLEETAKIERAWKFPTARKTEIIDDLTELATLLLQSTVVLAVRKGALRHWRGDIGLDATPALAWGRRPSKARGPLDIGAGRYHKGGTRPQAEERPGRQPKAKHSLWAYSLSLVITGHEGTGPVRRYPQLCLAMELHPPHSGIDVAGIRALRSLERFGFPKRRLAVDRAYSALIPENFQNVVRDLGYDLVMDYSRRGLAPQGTTHGARWLGGQLYCPGIPERLAESWLLLAKGTTEAEKERGREQIQHAQVYRMQRKERPGPNGTWRAQCPAAGPSPTVICPLAEERDGRPQRPTTVSLDDPKSRRRAALPQVRPNASLRLTPPLCCSQATVTVPVEDNAKYRQSLAHGTPEWEMAYKPIRAHNEGGNGWLKAADLNLDDRHHRRPRGRVAQTILIALMIAVANLRQLEQFVRGQHTRPSDILQERQFNAAPQEVVGTAVPAGVDGLPPGELPP